MYAPIIALHLIAATIWTGGHIVLFFVILLPALKSRNPMKITEFESHFEKIGIPALVTLVATGIWMAYHQLPDLSLWFTFSSAVSRTVTLKLSLLLLTVILAAHARLRILPALGPKSLNSLAAHITAVTILAILFALTGVMHRFGGIW